MVTPKVWRWLLAAAGVGLVVAAVLIALPMVVRQLAVRRVEAMTGRPVAIRDVDLNLFTRHLVFHDVAIASPADAAPLATVPRIGVRFRITPLFRGRVHLDELVLVRPSVVVVRREGDRVSVEDVIEHWRQREGGEPVDATVERIRVERGAITFADYAVDPDRRWIVENLTLEAHDIVTVTDAAAGRASARFVVAGANAEVELTELSLRPLRAHASIRLDALDVAPFSAYMPEDAPVRLAGGRFTTRMTVEYDAGGLVRASGDSTIGGLVLSRSGQDAPFVTVPHVTLSARDVTYAETLSVADATISAEQATVLDASAPRARPLTIRHIRLGFHDNVVPAAGPGRVTVSARLPGDGAIEARGTGEILPPRGDLQVDLRGLDLTLAAMWLPPGAAVEPLAGEIGATLAVRYALKPGLTVGGRAWVEGLELARGEDTAPFLRDDRVEITASDVTVGGVGAALGRVELVASPTLVPRPGASALDVSALTVTATGGGLGASDPTRIEARIELPHDGTVTASGQARLGQPDASFTVVARGIDARLAAPYVPRGAVLAVERGRLDANLVASWTGALHIDGRLTARRLTVTRAGQEPPLIEHARLDAEVTDLRMDAGGLSLDRVVVSGAPVIVDGSASPPERFEIRELRLAARHLTWPGRRPIELEGYAETAEGGHATLRGTLDPRTLGTDVRLSFDNVALARAGGYLRDTVPLTIDGGRAQGSAHLRYARGGPVRVAGAGTLVDLALTITTPSRTQVTDDRLSFAVDDVVASDGAVTVRAASVDASPVLTRAGEAGTPIDVHAEVRDLTWPGGGPAALSIAARSGDGRIEVDGVFTPSTRALEVSVRAKDAALAPFAALIPIEAPIAGTLDAEGRIVLRPGTATGVVARGEVAVRDLRVGSEDTAPVRVGQVRVEGVALEGRSLDIARVDIERPSMLIERNDDGSFPLRAMLAPEASGAASPGASSARDDGGRPAPASRKAPTDPLRFTADDVRLTDGTVRFIDRTTTPFYSEEATDLTIRIRDLTNVGDDRAGVSVQGIIGADGALELRGEMAPFATPFFLEVSGELRDFAVPRTNPYLRRLLDWIARRGELTTQVHYRIVGDELQGTNELVVHRLDVQRARDDDRTERLVGVPLGLAVALMKDAKGDIAFTLPVSGELGSPKFSFGDAIRSALSNVLGRLVTSPLRAIGSVFRRDNGGDAVAIAPVTFETGSAALTPEAAAHLQRVADVLRASPYVRMRIEGAVSGRDLQALRTRQVVARIQRTQRRAGLDGFPAAARQVWQASMPPGSVPPDDAEGIVRILAARAPAPTDAARELARRRESATRTHLVDAAGIPGDRIVRDPGSLPLGVDGDGRVEFTLEPTS